MNFCVKNTLTIFAICLVIFSTTAKASPPACRQNTVSKFISADAAVEAVVVKSRRWSEAGTTIHLVSKYEILKVFKGNVEKGEIIIVTDTCLDKPVPRKMAGYPVVQNYCRGSIGLSLTGVNSLNGTPIRNPEGKPSWILFLRKDVRVGAPELTWLEISNTGYYGGCRKNKNSISPDDKDGFDHLRQRLNKLGRQQRSSRPRSRKDRSIIR